MRLASAHMRCRITASLRASAGHLVLRISREWSALCSAVSVAPMREGWYHTGAGVAPVAPILPAFSGPPKRAINAA